MILVDTLIKFKDLLDRPSFLIFLEEGTNVKFDSKEKKDIKELVVFLTQNNLWTVEDLKNKIQKH